MSCSHKNGLVRTELQTGAILSGGYGLSKFLRTIGEVLKDSFELSRACNRMIERRRGRQKLLELDDHLLEDIGVTRDQAEGQARKWFWQ